MIAAMLLIVFVGLFAAMALAPLAIEETERVEERRRHAVKPVPMPARRLVAEDRDPVAA
ncbi:MAG: hypothetical protein QM753_08575 [Thermomicrobiales bacterium]